MPNTGTVVVERFESRRLQGNPLGDPAVREIPLYLPPGYADAPERRYPTIYWLHGYTGTSLSALNYNPWVPNLPQIADTVIDGGVPPFILVMVDGFTKYGGSQFINSSATGPYEDYVVQELVPWIDSRYRTLPTWEARGIDGKSSGGYGALVLGMRHPDVFGGVASHSGDMYFQYCYLPDFPKFLTAAGKHGSVEAFLRAFLAMPKKSGEMVTAMNVAAMAMAYSPNPASPDGFDLPFQLWSGELRPEVWQRWLDHDPVFMASHHADALRRLKLLYFECGTRDEYNLQFGGRILAQRLRDLAIPHEYQEFDDTHGNINYRYPESLSRLARALSP